MEKTKEHIPFEITDALIEVLNELIDAQDDKAVLEQLRDVHYADIAEILDDLNKYANDSLNKSNDDSIRDGMDITLCSINFEEMKLRFAGANNPVYLVRNGELEIYKTNRFAIGSFTYGEHNYENFELDLKKGDKVYAFSDGYPDQFGGPRGKKFMYKKFKELLVETVNDSMETQKKLLEDRLAEWMGDEHEQVDDIVIFAVEID